MKAAGVYPSPAGLWNWGHSIGMGYRKSTPNSELITTLLPSSRAIITKNGVKWAGSEYHSDFSQSQEWACHARNFGAKPININYFPGSLQKIWTPHEAQKGLLELNKSDYTGSSQELSLEEIIDAHAFKLSQNESTDHQNTIVELNALKMMNDLVQKSKSSTKEADAEFKGKKPTINEARAYERSVSSNNYSKNQNISSISNQTKDDVSSESQQNHSQMMEEILQSMSDKGELRDYS